MCSLPQSHKCVSHTHTHTHYIYSSVCVGQHVANIWVDVARAAAVKPCLFEYMSHKLPSLLLLLALVYQLYASYRYVIYQL